MIIKVLLFIIVLIFVYEFYNTIYTMKEEYFITNKVHTRHPIRRHTTQHNNRNTNLNTNWETFENQIKFMPYYNHNDYYNNPNNDYSNIIIDKQIQNDENTNEISMRKVISEYIPNERGLVRPWLEVHSHIPNYSNILNYGK